MKTLEWILCGIAGWLIVLNTSGVRGTSTALVLALAALACFYMIAGFSFYAEGNIHGFPEFIAKTARYRTKRIWVLVCCMALALCITGILYKLMFWRGAGNLLVSGIAATVLLMLGFFRMKKSTDWPVFRKMLLRLLVVFLIAAVIFEIPDAALVDAKFRNYPEYAKALKASLADPDNQELNEKRAEAWLEMKKKRK